MKLFILYVIIVAAASGQKMPPAAEQKLAHDIYKELIEINSSVTTSTTTPVAQAMATRFRAAGFPESDIFLGGPVPGKYNLVVRYHGTGARKPLLLLAHTDVVEAKREDWSPEFDPFKFTEKNGYYYGRGTATTRPRQRSGSPLCSGINRRATNRTGISLSLLPRTKKVADTTESAG